jgi:hypothetical protein
MTMLNIFYRTLFLAVLLALTSDCGSSGESSSDGITSAQTTDTNDDTSTAASVGIDTRITAWNAPSTTTAAGLQGHC